ncbi:MAG: DinB family protein [Planctomycetota bacterium]|jgi:uncharacterized damage-inducible protein DinB
MSEVLRIKDLISSAYDGPNWYGMPLVEIMKGLEAGGATSKLDEDSKSIWEIVLHVTAWTREVDRRLAGLFAFGPEEGDWPLVPEPTPANWSNTLEDLEAAHSKLMSALDDFPEDRLGAVVGSEREAQAGVTFHRMLHGLIHHTVYHSAQIAMTRRSQP